MSSIIIRFDNTKVPKGADIELRTAEKSFNPSWNGVPEDIYALIFYDVDAPYPDDPEYSPYLHWLVTNIPDDQVDQGDALIPYQPPTPPSDSPPHKYVVEVYTQKDYIRPRSHVVRKNFRINEFIKRNKLDLFAKTYFYTQSEAGPKAYEAPLSEERRTEKVSPALVKAYKKISQNSPALARYRNESPKDRERAEKKKEERDRYFVPNNPLTNELKKYESCVMKVAYKNPEACEKKDWGGGGCYNPYAVCGGGVKAEVSKWIDFEALPNPELIGFARSHDIEVPKPYKRTLLIDRVEAYMENRRKLHPGGK